MFLSGQARGEESAQIVEPEGGLVALDDCVDALAEIIIGYADDRA